MHRPAKRFLLVDDHPIMSDALRYTLETVAPDSKVEFAASYGEARRLLAEGNRIDCILLDLGLPDSDGYDALQGLRLLRPDTPVVVLSADGERDTIMRCLNLGAQGFIPKTVHHDVLRYALQMVAAGHMYVPKEVVTNTGWTPANAMSRVQPARATSRDPRSLGLTGRRQPERARRRVDELTARGESIDEAQLTESIRVRDERDRHVMQPAVDAVHINGDTDTPAQTLAYVLQLVANCPALR